MSESTASVAGEATPRAPAPAGGRGPVLLAAVLERHGYVVGGANAPSGVHRHEGGTAWRHLGWRNARASGLSFDPLRRGTWFMASGNGVFRSYDGGERWRVTTGWEVAEVQDVAVDPHVRGRVIAVTAFGAWRSDDDGEHWIQANAGLPAPQATYLQAVEVDRSRPGHVVAGGEAGLFRSTDAARRWSPVGPAGAVVLDVRQSAAAPEVWLAGTRGAGVLRSGDGGRSWTPTGEAELGGLTIYSVALDPVDPGRMAAAGYGTGVYLTVDGGRRWTLLEGLPQPTVHALAFEPGGTGRLWAGTVGAGVFRTDVAEAAGGGWTYAGLDGATIRDMTFVEDVV